jgi:putative membrane protein
MMRHQIFDSFAGFDDFLVYLAISLVLLYVFVWLYIRVTPWAEMALIRAGNMAAAFSLSGAILGFIVPLSAAIKYSVNLVDMVIWGVIALVVQIAAFVVVKLLVPSLAKDIEAGNGAQGFFLGVTSLAAGLLNAACMSY